MIDFAQFKREMEVKHKRDYSIAEIARGAKVSRDTVTRLMNGDVTRIDMVTASKLCQFFQVKPGPVPFIRYEAENKTPVPIAGYVDLDN